MSELWLIGILFFSLCLYYMFRNKLAVFFPSFSGMIDIIEGLVDTEEDDIIYDLGSGDGRILERFAKKNLKCIGIEHNPILNNIARKKLEDYSNVQIIEDNIFDQDISKATVIVAYLSRFVTKKLQKKIKQECKQGTKVIIVSYKFSDWKPFKVRKWLWLPIRLYLV